MEHQNNRNGIWFALATDGDMHYLGHCGDFEAAEASADDLGIDAIWIIDAEQARQWLACLSLVNNQK